jgi:hypothetical protein
MSPDCKNDFRVAVESAAIQSENNHLSKNAICDAQEMDDGGDVVLSIEDFMIRLAGSESECHSASMLIKKMYSWRGYSSSHQISLGPHQITLTAFIKNALVGTVTISIDSPTGLLADDMFKDEIDMCRGKDRKICELTKLAFDQAPRSAFALASIFHVCFIYARRIHLCTDSFIEINPRHRRYYERMLGFQKVGTLKTSARVDAPAYLLRLGLDHMEAEIRKHGGTSEYPGATKSLYPHFFSLREEEEIAQRLVALLNVSLYGRDFK